MMTAQKILETKKDNTKIHGKPLFNKCNCIVNKALINRSQTFFNSQCTFCRPYVTLSLPLSNQNERLSYLILSEDEVPCERRLFLVEYTGKRKSSPVYLRADTHKFSCHYVNRVQFYSCSFQYREACLFLLLLFSFFLFFSLVTFLDISYVFICFNFQFQ